MKMQNSQTTAVTTFFPSHFLPASSAQRCVQHDLKQINSGEDTPIIFVEPIEGNFLHLEAAITGPLSTPYENGIFLLDIKLSDQYPVRQPIFSSQINN
jgi:ubiquitin-protein ligase